MAGRAGGVVVVRGGALGDFLLTLPGARALRDASDGLRIGWVARPEFARLAAASGLCDEARPIDSAGLAGFYAEGGELDAGWAEWFGGFDAAVVFGAGAFTANLGRTGVGRVVRLEARPLAGEHAGRYWSSFGAMLGAGRERASGTGGTLVRPSDDDRRAAAAWLDHAMAAGSGRRCWVAVHPGSSSPRKNLPPAWWAEWACGLARGGRGVVLIAGEADADAARGFLAAWPPGVARPALAAGLGLGVLAGVLERCTFYAGHDSGVTHLAAALVLRVAAVFVSTDPHQWAPEGAGVTVVDRPAGPRALGAALGAAQSINP